METKIVVQRLPVHADHPTLRAPEVARVIKVDEAENQLAFLLADGTWLDVPAGEIVALPDSVHHPVGVGHEAIEGAWS